MNQNFITQFSQKYKNPGFDTTILNCTFNALQARWGGGVAIFKSNASQFLYQNIFTNCFAYNLGGAILMNKRDSIVINKDQIKGLHTNFDSVGVSFLSKAVAPSWRINTYKFLTNEYLVKNWTEAQINNDISSFNATFTSSNISQLFFTAYQNSMFPYLLNFSLIHNDGKVAMEFTQVVISTFNTNDPVHSISFTNIFNGSILVQSINFQAVNNLSFKIQSDNQQNGILFYLESPVDIEFTLGTEECTPGDIQELNGCRPCPNNTYTLGSSSQLCSRCPDNMICLGGNNIYPAPGYYKLSHNSSKAIRCLNPSACLGGIKNQFQLDSHGFCNDKFAGTLCSSCVSGYTPSENGQYCIECTNDIWFYIKLVIKVGVTLGLVLFQVGYKLKKSRDLKIAYESGNEEIIQETEKRFDGSCAIKLMVTLLQMLTIVKAINFEWNNELRVFYGYGSDLIPLVIHQFSSRCLFIFENIDEEIGFYLEFLLTILSPIFLLLLLVILFFIAYLLKRRQNQDFAFWDLTKSSAVVLFYIFQPEVVLETLGLFKCRQLSDDNSYLQRNLNIQCYSSTYYKWALLMGLPSFVFWGLFIPTYYFRQIYKGMKQAKDEDDSQKKYDIITKYSFIVSGYKEEKYYWEFLIIVRKTLMILFVIILSQNDQVTQGVFIQIILALSLFIHLKYQAYKNNDVGLLDTLSLVAIFVMIHLGLYFDNKDLLDEETKIKATNYITVYILSAIGIFLVAICGIQFIILIFNIYWKKVSRKFSKFAKSLASHEIQQSMELDIVFKGSESQNTKDERYTSLNE